MARGDGTAEQRPGPAGSPLPRRSASERAYELLLQRLISAEIPPGSKITVDRLARELDVSQTPIRQALTRLEADGLVTKTHLVGYSAADRMSAAQFDDLYDMRVLLEPFAAARAADRAPDAEIAEMRRIAVSMRDLDGETKDGYAAFARADAELHAAIARGAGSALLNEYLVRLNAHLHLFRLRHDSLVTREAIEEHDLIIAAISARDAGAAETAMADHVVRSRARLGAGLVE